MRTYKFIIAFLLLLLATTSALALTYPTDPYRESGQPFPLDTDGDDISVAAATLSVNVSVPSNITTSTDYTFSVSTTGGVAPYEYRYNILSIDEERSAESNTIYLQHNYLQRDTTSDNTFSWKFYSPGTYYFRVTVTDSNGNSASNGYNTKFTVSGTDYLQQKLESIAAECMQNASTEFDRALWLHDWLTTHAYYDYSYSRYTTEGVVMEGFGVCDSYRHAYTDLLSLVGISSVGVISDSGNHAWNAVNLEDEWYNVDVTWDDPSGADDVPISGYECWDFFGLPDEILHTVDSHQPSGNPPACTSYDCNYYIHTGEILTSSWYKEIINAISAEISSYNDNVHIRLWGEYPHDDYFLVMSHPYIFYGIAAHYITENPPQVGGYDVDAIVDYSVESPLELDYSYKFARVNASEDQTLVIPENISEIGTEAFQNTDATLVVFPDNGNTITVGKDAFADMSALREIEMSTNVIFEDSLDTDILIVLRGTDAEAMAADYRSQGMRVRVE